LPALTSAVDVLFKKAGIARCYSKEELLYLPAFSLIKKLMEELRSNYTRWRTWRNAY
jgi:hypothetical protein